MNTAQLTSQNVKQAFANHGIKVRVRHFVRGYAEKFRVCMVGDVPHDQQKSVDIAASLGLVSSIGERGGQFNQAHEMVCYKPR